MRKQSVGTILMVVCLAMSIGMALIQPAVAEHFDMLLRITGGDKQAQASMDTTPPIGGVNPRPVLRIKAGDLVQIHWRMKNSSPHGVQKGVTLHFFVAHEARTGQKPVPDPAGPAGLIDNSFTTDLAPGAVSTGSLKLKLAEVGSYIVRVQSEDTHEEYGHEHFSAIDIEVQ